MGASDIRVGSTSPVVNDRSEGFFWPGSGSFLLALALLVSRKPLAKRPRPILPSMKRMSVLVFCMTVAMASASCSSDGDATGVASLELDTQPESESSADLSDLSDRAEVEEAVLAFSQCLRDNGFDVDDPTFDADGNPQFPSFGGGVVDDATAEQVEDFDAETARMEDALQACRTHLDGIVMTAPDSEGQAETEDVLLEYTACMRDNGIDMPDPDFSGSGGVIEIGDQDVTDSQFEAADEVCRRVFTRPGSDSGLLISKGEVVDVRVHRRDSLIVEEGEATIRLMGAWHRFAASGSVMTTFAVPAARFRPPGVEQSFETSEAAQNTHHPEHYRSPTGVPEPADQCGAPPRLVVATPRVLSAGSGNEGGDDVGGVPIE